VAQTLDPTIVVPGTGLISIEKGLVPGFGLFDTTIEVEAGSEPSTFNDTYYRKLLSGAEL